MKTTILDVTVTTDTEAFDTDIQILPLGTPAPPASVPGDVTISADSDNRLTVGRDGGLYVRDNFVPDPVAYFILAKS